MGKTGREVLCIAAAETWSTRSIIPKRRLGIIRTQVVDWRAVDAREEADREIDDMQHLAEMSQRSFIDGRITERLICSVCSSQIDLTKHFRNLLVAV